MFYSTLEFDSFDWERPEKKSLQLLWWVFHFSYLLSKRLNSTLLVSYVVLDITGRIIKETSQNFHSF